MPDRLATDLMLIARNPASGRLRRPRRLDIGLRAALFTDLLLERRIADESGAPAATGSPDSGDRVLDAVARAVASRPNVSWWRWFRHVRADRDVLVAELVDSGRWTPRRAGPFRAWDDAEDLAVQAQRFDIGRVVSGHATPRDARQAALAAIAGMCGALDGQPRPRALGGDLKPLLDAVAASGEPGSQHIPRMITGATRLSRHPMRR